MHKILTRIKTHETRKSKPLSSSVGVFVNHFNYVVREKRGIEKKNWLECTFDISKIVMTIIFGWINKNIFNYILTYWNLTIVSNIKQSSVPINLKCWFACHPPWKSYRGLLSFNPTVTVNVHLYYIFMYCMYIASEFAKWVSESLYIRETSSTVAQK